MPFGHCFYSLFSLGPDENVVRTYEETSEEEKFTFLLPRRRSTEVHAVGVNDVWPGELLIGFSVFGDFLADFSNMKNFFNYLSNANYLLTDLTAKNYFK